MKKTMLFLMMVGLAFLSVSGINSNKVSVNADSYPEKKYFTTCVRAQNANAILGARVTNPEMLEHYTCNVRKSNQTIVLWVDYAYSAGNGYARVTGIQNIY